MLALLKEPLSSQLLTQTEQKQVQAHLLSDLRSLANIFSHAQTKKAVLSPLSLTAFFFRGVSECRSSGLCLCVCVHCLSPHSSTAALVGRPQHLPLHQLHPDSSKVVSPGRDLIIDANNLAPQAFAVHV